MKTIGIIRTEMLDTDTICKLIDKGIMCYGIARYGMSWIILKMV